MDPSKYISKRFVIRMLMVLAVIVAAVLLDSLHEGSEKLVSETQQRSESQFLHANPVFYYNQLSQFRPKKGVDRLFSRLLIAVTQKEFLSRYHNYRAFHLLKAEARRGQLPFVRVVHFSEFTVCHRSTADDDHCFAG